MSNQQIDHHPSISSILKLQKRKKGKKSILDKGTISISLCEEAKEWRKIHSRTRSSDTTWPRVRQDYPETRSSVANVQSGPGVYQMRAECGRESAYTGRVWQRSSRAFLSSWKIFPRPIVISPSPNAPTLKCIFVRKRFLYSRNVIHENGWQLNSSLRLVEKIEQDRNLIEERERRSSTDHAQPVKSNNHRFPRDKINSVSSPCKRVEIRPAKSSEPL